MATQDDIMKMVPPNNMEAEQAVLGSMMMKKSAVADAAELLNRSDFYRDAHGIVFETMLKLSNDNVPVDIVTLSEQLDKENLLEKVGGPAFIAGLANAVPSASNVTYYANIVREKADLRNLINAASDITAMAFDGEEDVPTILDKAEKRIMDASSRHMSGDFTPINQIVIESIDKINTVYESRGGLTGIPTEFTDLDKLTSGLQPSDLILVAARPSMGKTAFTLNIASNVAIREKKSVAFFSLEMSKTQLMQRMLCSEASLDSQKVRIGDIPDEDWHKLMMVAEVIGKAPLYIDDTAGIQVNELRSKARRLKSQHGLDLIIIDYLQLMQGSGKGNGDNRQAEIAEISRSLKSLARELNVPIIALSQLSRGVESRQIKRPMLSDLRESGSLEQDADIVMFLYREDYYEPETANKNITEVIVAKHRNGPVDTVKLFFQKAYTRFDNLSKMQ